MTTSITTRAAVAAMLSLLAGTAAAAQGGQPLLDRGQISIGGGLALNSVDGPLDDDEIGFQFFGAYHLDQVNLIDGVATSVEAGYMDYGFDRGNSGGLWINGVLAGAVDARLGWLARAGLDLGDDDGIMLGGGISFGIADRSELRIEYVIRDNIDSLQLNLVHRL